MRACLLARRPGTPAELLRLEEGAINGRKINLVSAGSIYSGEASGRSICELLGLDPIHVANEGKLVAIVAPELADAVLAAMKAHPLGPTQLILAKRWLTIGNLCS